MEVKIETIKEGFEVTVGKSILPGYFLDLITAKKHADKYISLIRQDTEKRKKSKEGK